MTNVMKGMMLILMILYIISPIDLCPGPIDDLIVFLMAFSMQNDD